MDRTTDADETLATDLVREALDGIDRLLTPEEVEMVRGMLEIELLSTGEGRDLLRSCRPDPIVAESGDVVVGAPAPERKRGTGQQ